MDLEKRLIDLETKISFQDKVIEDLHEVIYQQQQQLSQIEKSLESFKNQVKSGGENEIRPNEKPPHY